MTYPFRDHPPAAPSTCACGGPCQHDGSLAVAHLEDQVFAEVAAERARQDVKWGQQDHPDLSPVLKGRPFPELCAARLYGIPLAGEAKALTDGDAAAGRSSWAAILTEELAEYVEAAAMGDEDAARTELVQLGAVAVQAVQAIDRRRAAREGADR